MDTSAVLITTMQHRRGVIEQALAAAGWKLHTYSDVAAALEHLKTKPYASVFCDETLRGASVGGFLAWSRRIAPDVPFYVIATTGDHTSLMAVHAPDGVVAFPPDAGSIPRPVKASMWDVPAANLRDLPLEGRTSLMRLSDLIEMLALSAASGVVTLGAGQVGRVYLSGGQLEHVVCVQGSLESTGVRALARLLILPDADFQVLPYRTPSRRTIHVSTAAALSEAARLIDEQERDAELLEAVARASPEATGIAVGYALAESPSDVRADGRSAFASGVQALSALKQSVGHVSHLAIESEREALAAVRYGDENLLVATAPRGRSVVLLAALAKVVKQTRH